MPTPVAPRSVESTIVAPPLAGTLSVLVSRKARAFALRRQRERHAPITDDGELGERPTAPEITHDQAALYERLRLGAEALERLKPQQARALRLRAKGYSYSEICRITAWSYTKVNRCLTEGRRACVRGPRRSTRAGSASAWGRRSPGSPSAGAAARSRRLSSVTFGPSSRTALVSTRSGALPPPGASKCAIEPEVRR
jgi:Sigma-70, region 4